jgi:glycerophosphoryl diester phosphodiesterase
MLPQLTIVAHRGASTEAPENTLAAFSRARDLGVAAIESDVRVTRDGEFVLCHDESLLRIAGRPENIADLDLATLRDIVIGVDPAHGAQRIVTLAELLQLAAGHVRVLLDLKLPSGHEEQLLDTVRTAGSEREVIVGVRSIASLQTFKATAPQLATLAFGRTPPEVWAMAAAGADIVRLWSPWVDADTLAQAERRGTLVWVMCGAPGRGDVGETTVPELLAYRRAGITGVILNDPRLALEANARNDATEG